MVDTGRVCDSAVAASVVALMVCRCGGWLQRWRECRPLQVRVVQCVPRNRSLLRSLPAHRSLLRSLPRNLIRLLPRCGRGLQGHPSSHVSVRSLQAVSAASCSGTVCGCNVFRPLVQRSGGTRYCHRCSRLRIVRWRAKCGVAPVQPAWSVECRCGRHMSRCDHSATWPLWRQRLRWCHHGVGRRRYC